MKKEMTDYQRYPLSELEQCSLVHKTEEATDEGNEYIQWIFSKPLEIRLVHGFIKIDFDRKLDFITAEMYHHEYTLYFDNSDENYDLISLTVPALSTIEVIVFEPEMKPTQREIEYKKLKWLGECLHNSINYENMMNAFRETEKTIGKDNKE